GWVGGVRARGRRGPRVAGGEEDLVRLPRVAVSRTGGVDVAPGAVFGPYPARVAARPLGLAGHGPADRPHAARPVLGVEQVDDRRAAQRIGPVPVAGHRVAGGPDNAG